MGVIRKPEYEETRAEYDVVLNHFNWGAFFFDWMWGLANGCLGKMKLVFVILILLLVPFVNILAGLGYLVLKIYFGLKGNEWAYEGRAFYSPQDFEDTQKRWAIAGLAVYLPIIILGIIIGIFFAIISSVLMMYLSHSGVSNDMTNRSYHGPIPETLAIEIIEGENTRGTFSTG